MRPLELDFHRKTARSRRAVGVLALAALAFVTHAAFLYSELRKEIAAKEARLALRVPLRQADAKAAAGAGSDEFSFARETLMRLTVPWGSLFAALEGARTEGVALLSVEPNAEARALRLTGEAKDYLRALSYVANLSEQSTLQGVHLVRHELVRGQSGAPVSFIVSASWKDAP